MGRWAWCVRNGEACLNFSEEQNMEMGDGIWISGGGAGSANDTHTHTHTHTHWGYTGICSTYSLSSIHTHRFHNWQHAQKDSQHWTDSISHFTDSCHTHTSHTKRSRMFGPRCNTLSRKRGWCRCVYVCVVIAAGIFSQDGVSQFPLIA